MNKMSDCRPELYLVNEGRSGQLDGCADRPGCQ